MLNTLFRRLPFDLPLSTNWIGILVIALGAVYALVKQQRAKAKAQTA